MPEKLKRSLSLLYMSIQEALKTEFFNLAYKKCIHLKIREKNFNQIEMPILKLKKFLIVTSILIFQHILIFDIW